MYVGAAGRVSLVTGGTDGIGRAVALQLAEAGDRVLLVGRNTERAAEVLEELHAIRPGPDHAFLQADLSLLADTSRVAKEVRRLTKRLDAVVFCAGILSIVPEWTAEGLERNFVLNYLNRYLLARLLLPILRKSPAGRVVLVSNAGRYGDTLDFDDLQHRNGKPGMHVAGRTQFANDLLATELGVRLRRSTRIRVACVYPGIVRTRVFRNSRGLPWIVRAIASGVQRVVGIAPDVAAQTPASLAHDASAMQLGSSFFGPRLKRLQIPPRAQRRERREGLWAASEKLVEPYLSEAEQGGAVA